MKAPITKSFCSLFLLTFGCSAMADASDSEAVQQITRAEEHIIIHAPSEYFSGHAEFSRFPIFPSTRNVAPAVVRFAAGTVTNWHIHPHGQYLIVTEGEGRTQQWGKLIQVIKKGDIVWCPPGVKHWHGAGAKTAMTHIAISPLVDDGKKVTWLEKVELPADKSVSPETAKVITPVILTDKQLGIVSIAAFNATGNLEKLKPALVKGLEHGLTVNEIKEIFAHQYAYVGFPRALNGMLTFRDLLNERQQQGIKDVEGPLPTTLASDTNYYELGNQTLATLTGRPLEKTSLPLFDNFSPTMDHALKAHLFGYLFSRDNLGYVERELVVTSSLSALGNVNAQLRSHLRIAKNLGLDDVQLHKVIMILNQNMGEDIARNAEHVLENL